MSIAEASGTTIRVEAVGGVATTSSGSTPEPSGLADGKAALVDDKAAPAVAR